MSKTNTNVASDVEIYKLAYEIIEQYFSDEVP